MRCKKHPTDTSGTVGVCASCLRERLFNLIAVQTQADLAQAQAQYHQNRHGHGHGQHHSQPYFPRSVSPYVTSRKSDTSNPTNNHHHHHHITFPFPRFFSTPQFGPTAASESAKKKKGGKFAVIKNLFRFSGNNKTSSSSSKMRDPCSSSLPVTQDYGRPCRVMDRGMSPVRSSSHDESDILNGYGPRSPLQIGSRLTSHNRRGFFNGHVS